MRRSVARDSGRLSSAGMAWCSDIHAVNSVPMTNLPEDGRTCTKVDIKRPILH